MTNKIRILRTIEDVRTWRLDRVLQRKTVGLVPTMGALHAGHCSLVNQSLSQNDSTIVSIFVNPSQFAPHEDLNSYPRTMDQDIAKLSELMRDNKGVDVVFAPKVSEMYPSGIPLNVDEQQGAFVTVHGVSEQLEGSIRPQFFRGVATVVTKLLNIVSPTKAYFGQKDAQQTVVVRRLVKDLLLPTEVVVMPTVRETTGLAMSSRNAYLTEDTRTDAKIIYESLKRGEAVYENGVHGAAEVVAAIKASMTPYTDGSRASFSIEYICISHPETLEELQVITPGVGAIVSTAIRVPNSSGGEARLIDNLVLH